MPNEARWKVQSPTEVTKSPAETQISTQSPFEANNLRQSPFEANVSTRSRANANKSNQSPLKAKPLLPENESPVTVTNTVLLIVIEPVEAQISANENMLTSQRLFAITISVSFRFDLHDKSLAMEQTSAT